MSTVTEHELRRRLWEAGADDVDPARVATLADDALGQARHRQRVLRTVATLSTVLIVAAVGVTASSMAAHSPRPLAPATSVVAGQRDPVRLATPVRLLPVLSVSPGACTTSGYPGTSTNGTTTSTSCFHVDEVHGMSVAELSGISAVRLSTVQPSDSWAVKLTLPDADKAAFAHLTEGMVGRQLAIVVDGRVLNAPQVAGAITTGTIPITGCTQQSAKALIKQLTGG